MKLTAALSLATVSLLVPATPPRVETVSLPGSPRIDGLFIANDGRMFGAGTYKGSDVYRVLEDGQHEVVATGFEGPVDIGMDGAGNLYVTNFNGASVSRITPDGESEVWARVDVGPAGIVVEADGTVFVAHYGSANGSGRTITRIAPDRSVSTFATDEELRAPIGLARGPGGSLYSANYFDGKVFRFDAEGNAEPFTEVLLPDGSPAQIGHISTGRGGLIATGGPSNRLFFIDEYGEVSLLSGDGTSGTKDGALDEATYENPNGIAEAPNGDVYIATAGSGPGDRSKLRRIVFAEQADAPKQDG